MMKKLLKKFSVFTIVFSLALGIKLMQQSMIDVKADAILPIASNNLNIGLRKASRLVATDDGYMRVFYDGEKIRIENYDDNFNILNKKSIAMELKIWGGFYAGSDAYYVVEGQNNTDENDAAEVIRVIKYNKDWKKLGVANITGNKELFGGEVRYPFHYGNVEMTEYNGTLYIVTGHEGYVDPMYNQGHQGFLMIAVDEAAMTGKIVKSDLWHSFAQYIENENSDLYVLELSEGSRYTKLSKIDAATLSTKAFPTLKYGGDRTSAWAINCFASVDGMALSSDNVLCIGTSIDQANYDNVTTDTAHNIYLTVTSMSDFGEESTTLKWLTNYEGDGKAFLGVNITKINDNRFMISWEEYKANQKISGNDGLSTNILHYMFVDGDGNKIGKEYIAAAPISDCQPIVKDSKIVYYASSENTVNFYTIDANTGVFSKKSYFVAGENISWELKDGVLTLSGSGEINPKINEADSSRYPVSSCENSYISYDSDTDWQPIRDNVKKIVVKSGIVSIPEGAFKYFDYLTEVELESGVKTIGKEAFAFCGSLEKIIIPASVTSIGKDILWTGYYWTSDESPVVFATICADKGSYAENYAKSNRIRYQDISAENDKDAEDDKDAEKDETTVRTEKIKKPSQVKITKVRKLKGGKAKISWKKIKSVKGYQVRYATNRKFKKATTKTIKKNVTSYTIKKLKKKKYYVQVRAYKVVKGEKYMGKWSKSKKITIK